MRPFHLLAASCFILALAPACATPDDDDDEPVGDVESAAGTTDEELAFIDRAYETFVAHATKATYDPLRDTSGSSHAATDMSTYYRATCSAALVGAVWARAHGRDPNPIIVTWIRDASADYRHFAEAAWGDHVRWAPAVDCLLAASVAAPWLTQTDRSTLRSRVAPVAEAVFTPEHYLREGAKWEGNSQAEEAALAGDLLYLASRLAATNDDQRSRWRGRSADLFRYAGSMPKAKPWNGEAFRHDSVTGTSLGADENVVTNHGMETNPYYSLGALISYADATAVARVGTGAHPPEQRPPGIVVERTQWTYGADRVLRDQLGVRQIFVGAMRRVDLGSFGWKGKYHWFDENGRSGTFDYGAQTQTIPIFTPGSDLLIPTNGTGNVTEFLDPADGKIKGYQVDGDELRAFECGDEARGTFCRARYKSKLADQWSTANVAEQSRFGAYPIPKSGIDTFTQWIENGTTTIGTDVFAGGRVWRYVCSGSPRSCRAVDSVPLATHFARYGFSGSSLPAIGRVDAASAFVHVDGTGRRYWVSGNRMYRAVCRADFTGCSAASNTLAEQFGGLGFSPALPTDRVDSLVQFVNDGSLWTYVFRGDRLWKYVCTRSGCTPGFTKPIAEQWLGITNQERWANGTLTTLRGVTDWGVQATMMNAAFALARRFGVDGGAYAELLTHQRDDLRLRTQSLLPSTYDAATGRFGYGVFREAAPVGRYGALAYLEDGHEARHVVPLSRLNSFAWMDIFAARNHAVAYMLTSSKVLPQPL